MTRRRTRAALCALLLLASKDALADPPHVSPEAPPAHASAFVHLESEPAMELSSAEANPSPWSEAPLWRHVCSAPCDRALPLDGTYRLDGPGVRPTAPFRLGARAGDRVGLTMDAKPTSAFVGGTVLVSVGFVAVGVGAIVTLVSLHPFDPDAPPGDHVGIDVTGTVVGASVFAAGGIGGVVGLVLRARNETSTVVEVGARHAQAVASAPPCAPPRRVVEMPRDRGGMSTYMTPRSGASVVLPIWAARF